MGLLVYDDSAQPTTTSENVPMNSDNALRARLLSLASAIAQHLRIFIRHIRGLDRLSGPFDIIGYAYEFDLKDAPISLHYCVARQGIVILRFAHTAGVDDMPSAGQNPVVRQVRVTAHEHINIHLVQDALKAAVRTVFVKILVYLARAAVDQ